MTRINDAIKYYFNPILLKNLNLDIMKKYSIYEIYMECKKPKNNIISIEMKKIFHELTEENWFPPYYKMRFIIKNHIVDASLNNDEYTILNNNKYISIDHIEIIL